MRARLAVALALAGLGGCYHPTPAAGSYVCAADNACPSGQHCTCGLCVDHDDQAACSFTLKAASTDVEEHEQFALHLQALAADGKTAASGFNGTVTLSSSWGDVRVVGAPAASTVTLTAGQADAMVSLNRETLPPQTATLEASFGKSQGASNKVAVRAPAFARDVAAVVAPPSAAQPYAFADTLVAQPDVQKTPGGWRMYFGGLAQATGYMFGAAESTDGQTFTPVSSSPLEFSAGGTAFDAKEIASPSVFNGAGTVNLAFSGSDSAINGDSRIGLATSSDGVSSFALANSGQAVITPADCGYCDKSVDFPAVIADPAAVVGDGGAPTAWLMFFSATEGSTGVSIGRASSTDGIHFQPEPAPLLTGDLGGEAVLLSPRVLVDGTVFKMWYTYAGLADYKNNDLCQSTVKVGYATSDDGFYWIRSPSNPQMPMGTQTMAGWDDNVTAFLVGSVVPSDGIDAQNGISLYYSTWRDTAMNNVSICLPNGIGRATRR